MPRKSLVLMIGVVALVLLACGAKKESAVLPGDADALLKRAKEEMLAQKGFAVDQCEGYNPCEPGHEDFSLTYGPGVMLLHVLGYEHSPYSLISGPDCFYSQDGVHWIYAYCGGSDDSLYVDPRVLLSLAVEPKVEARAGAAFGVAGLAAVGAAAHQSWLG